MNIYINTFNINNFKKILRENILRNINQENADSHL